jgi:hypothetical protein
LPPTPLQSQDMPRINVSSLLEKIHRMDFDRFLFAEITEMLPGILNQLGAESLTHLKRLASNVSGGQGMPGMEGPAGTMDEEEDDEVPDLVENFDEVSKNETATEDAKISEVTEGNEIVNTISTLSIEADDVLDDKDLEDKDLSTKL